MYVKCVNENILCFAYYTSPFINVKTKCNLAVTNMWLSCKTGLLTVDCCWDVRCRVLFELMKTNYLHMHSSKMRVLWRLERKYEWQQYMFRTRNVSKYLFYILFPLHPIVNWLIDWNTKNLRGTVCRFHSKTLKEAQGLKREATETVSTKASLPSSNRQLMEKNEWWILMKNGGQGEEGVCVSSHPCHIILTVMN